MTNALAGPVVVYEEELEMEDAWSIDHESSDEGGVLYLVKESERIAHLTYKKPSASEYIVDYVEVQPSHRGRGFAKRLVEKMVEFGNQQDVGLEATCGVARGILKQMGEV